MKDLRKDILSEVSVGVLLRKSMHLHGISSCPDVPIHNPKPDFRSHQEILNGTS